MVKGDYTVRLERVFQGPMDLLLHLVREQEVEIQEIEISRILDDYLGYIEKLESLDLEVAGEFLVMAATLMAIKSRSLLPGEVVDLEEELDPRDELIQRLIEYRRFRGAADTLHEGYQERGRQSERGYTERPQPPEREYEIGELTAWDLLATFSRLMRETLADQTHHVQGDAHPLRYYVDQVVHRLQERKKVTLRGLMQELDDVTPREALVGSFCALLELVRLELIEVAQDEGETDIEITIVPEHEGDIESVIEHSLLEDDEAEAEAVATDTQVGDAADASAGDGASTTGVEPAPDEPAPPRTATEGNGVSPPG